MKREKIAEGINKTLDENRLTKRDIEIMMFIRGYDRNSDIAKERFLLSRTYKEISVKFGISLDRVRQICDKFIMNTKKYIELNKFGAFGDCCCSDSIFYKVQKIDKPSKEYLIAALSSIASNKRRYLTF